MSRNELLLPPEHLAPFALEAFVNEAATLNQRTVAAFAHPFPKAPDRWLSHDQFRPRPLDFTLEGEVAGGLSWLIGATIDLCFTRALLAPYDSKEGGHCDDPASSFFLEVASRMDGYPDSASFCADLRQQDKGRRYRELAGLHEAIPGEDDLCNFRRRVDASAIEAALAVFVGLCRDFGLIKGELLYLIIFENNRIRNRLGSIVAWVHSNSVCLLPARPARPAACSRPAGCPSRIPLGVH